MRARFRELREASGNCVGTSARGAPGGATKEEGTVPGTGAEPAGGGVTAGQNRKTFRLSPGLVLSPGLHSSKGLVEPAPRASSQTNGPSGIIKASPSPSA